MEPFYFLTNALKYFHCIVPIEMILKEFFSSSQRHNHTEKITSTNSQSPCILKYFYYILEYYALKYFYYILCFQICVKLFLFCIVLVKFDYNCYFVKRGAVISKYFIAFIATCRGLFIETAIIFSIKQHRSLPF